MHRRKEFRAVPKTVSKMLKLEEENKIKFIFGQLNSVQESEGQQLDVEYKNNEKKNSLIVDFLLPFYGLKMELGPIANWGLNLYENRIKVDT